MPIFTFLNFVYFHKILDLPFLPLWHVHYLLIKQKYAKNVHSQEGQETLFITLIVKLNAAFSWLFPFHALISCRDKKVLHLFH